MSGKIPIIAAAVVVVIIAVSAVVLMGPKQGALPQSSSSNPTTAYTSTAYTTIPSTTNTTANATNGSSKPTNITTYSGNWTLDSGSRITGQNLNGVPSAIQLQNGSIRLYYCTSSGSVSSIVSATSKNGLDFTPDAGTRISDGSTSVCNPSIMLLTNGSYRLYYSTFGAGNTQQLYTAISNDGLNFTNPTLLTDPQKSDWNNATGFASEPEVHYAANGTFVMYYNAAFPCPAPPFAPPPPSQWMAVSKDGVHFTQERCVLYPPSFDFSVSFSDFDWALLQNGTAMFIGDYVLPPTGGGQLPPNAKNSSYYGLYSAYSTDNTLLNYTTPKFIIKMQYPTAWFSDQDVIRLANGTFKMYYNLHTDQNGVQGVSIVSATWVPIPHTVAS